MSEFQNKKAAAMALTASLISGLGEEAMASSNANLQPRQGTGQVHEMSRAELAETSFGSNLRDLLLNNSAPRAQTSQAGFQNEQEKTANYYKVARGDSLLGIAARQLGEQSAWPLIAQVNNIESPFKIFPGQQLRLPDKQELETWLKKSPEQEQSVKVVEVKAGD